MTSIFPTVRPNLSGPYVSKKLLNRAKRESSEVLRNNKKYIETVFAKTMNVPRCSFDLAHALRMVANAITVHSDSVYGLCDGETIWISDGKMHYKNIVGTLIHEALHGTVRAKGREFTEEEEHCAMERLGDWYAKGTVIDM